MSNDDNPSSNRRSHDEDTATSVALSVSDPDGPSPAVPQSTKKTCDFNPDINPKQLVEPLESTSTTESTTAVVLDNQTASKQLGSSNSARILAAPGDTAEPTANSHGISRFDRKCRSPFQLPPTPDAVPLSELDLSRDIIFKTKTSAGFPVKSNDPKAGPLVLLSISYQSVYTRAIQDWWPTYEQVHHKEKRNVAVMCLTDMVKKRQIRFLDRIASRDDYMQPIHNWDTNPRVINKVHRALKQASKEHTSHLTEEERQIRLATFKQARDAQLISDKYNARFDRLWVEQQQQLQEELQADTRKNPKVQALCWELQQTQARLQLLKTMPQSQAVQAAANDLPMEAKGTALMQPDGSPQSQAVQATVNVLPLEAKGTALMQPEGLPQSQTVQATANDLPLDARGSALTQPEGLEDLVSRALLQEEQKQEELQKLTETSTTKSSGRFEANFNHDEIGNGSTFALQHPSEGAVPVFWSEFDNENDYAVQLRPISSTWDGNNNNEASMFEPIALEYPPLVHEQHHKVEQQHHVQELFKHLSVSHDTVVSVSHDTVVGDGEEVTPMMTPCPPPIAPLLACQSSTWTVFSCCDDNGMSEGDAMGLEKWTPPPSPSPANNSSIQTPTLQFQPSVDLPAASQANNSGIQPPSLQFQPSVDLSTVFDIFNKPPSRNDTATYEHEVMMPPLFRAQTSMFSHYLGTYDREDDFGEGTTGAAAALLQLSHEETERGHLKSADENDEAHAAQLTQGGGLKKPKAVKRQGLWNTKGRPRRVSNIDAREHVRTRSASRSKSPAEKTKLLRGTSVQADGVDEADLDESPEAISGDGLRQKLSTLNRHLEQGEHQAKSLEQRSDELWNKLVELQPSIQYGRCSTATSMLQQQQTVPKRKANTNRYRPSTNRRTKKRKTGARKDLCKMDDRDPGHEFDGWCSESGNIEIDSCSVVLEV